MAYKTFVVSHTLQNQRQKSVEMPFKWIPEAQNTMYQFLLFNSGFTPSSDVWTQCAGHVSALHGAEVNGNACRLSSLSSSHHRLHNQPLIPASTLSLLHSSVSNFSLRENANFDCSSQKFYKLKKESEALVGQSPGTPTASTPGGGGSTKKSAKKTAAGSGSGTGTGKGKKRKVEAQTDVEAESSDNNGDRNGDEEEKKTATPSPKKKKTKTNAKKSQTEVENENESGQEGRDEI